MIIDIRQDIKELYSAEFTVYRGQNAVGGFSVQGSMVSIEADVGGKFLTDNIAIGHKNIDILNVKKPFRPYIILCNGVESGVVYHTESGGGLKSYSFKQMQYKGMTYDCFSFGFGKEGGKEQIYSGSSLLAQIDTESIVYYDLHNYRIYAVDEYSAKLAVLFGMYGYVTCAFEPGKKIVSGKTKYYSKTLNKDLMAKYNSNFAGEITL
ncbi:hypothetical protein [Ruminococcus sp.]|uniref:hypothetical protein n=1 Tax=Ruminococcus sp. TaxID=41978 RepID=UPI00386A3FA5